MFHDVCVFRCNEGDMNKLHQEEMERAAEEAKNEYLRDHPEAAVINLKHNPVEHIQYSKFELFGSLLLLSVALWSSSLLILIITKILFFPLFFIFLNPFITSVVKQWHVARMPLSLWSNL